MGRFEILEHTADVGLRAWGDDLPDVFETATHALADISGTWSSGIGDPAAIEVHATDVEAVLVDWLNEVLWLQVSRDAVLTEVHVDRVDDSGAAGRVSLAPRDRELEGTAVKAVTYHQLEVARDQRGWMAQVFVDV